MRFSVFAAALFAAALAGPLPAGAQTPDAAKPEAKPEININEILPERVMGEPNAPLAIIEYASLTCGHCAQFHKEVLPRVVEKYIATGKLKLIYRDFPLDGNALKAAQLAQCMPEDRYFAFIKTLFEAQEAWSHAADVEATLVQYAKLAGLPGERVTACLANTAIQEALVKRRMEAEKQFRVEATPSFVVNYGAETISGIGTFDDFEKKLKKYLDKKPGASIPADVKKTDEKKTDEKK